MGDPLFTSALIGAQVSLLLKEVIDASKGAVSIKKSCEALKVKVDAIVPLLEVVEKNSANWEQALLNWMLEFNTILINAQRILEECLEESRAGKWMRLMKVWQWRRLPSHIRLINDQIDEARLNAILTTLGLNIQSSNSALKQSIPPLVVGMEKPFNKLKTSILASYTNDKSTVFGLQGSLGVGKTLLAGQLNNDEDIKAVYGSQGILWMTVGLDARISDLYKTMGKFLNDGVFEAEYAHRNQEDQRTYLWNAFAKKKVFLILDDVRESQSDHQEMLYWLNIASGPRSTTLITTPSAAILSKVHAEVEVVSLLSNEDSWTLFCAHAFQSGTLPPNISEDLAREVCKECGGFPLALEVLGMLMRDKHEMEDWHIVLLRLRQSEHIASLPLIRVNIEDVKYGRQLGQGSFGSVFQCKWYDRDIAVKSISLDVASPEHLEKFQTEVNILSSLCHPNIVRTFGYGFDTEGSGCGFIMMEQMETGLDKLIRKLRRDAGGSHVFPLDVSMDLMSQIVEGMCALRDGRVIHRDLKSGNILVNRLDNGTGPLERMYEVKLADFGTSKQPGADSSIFTTMKVGTAAYMAPEVIGVEGTGNQGYTWAADVYSFGIVCSEILTGESPFQHLKIISCKNVLAAVRGGERPKLPLDRADPLRTLIEDCWKLQPNERPDVWEIRRRLSECRQATPVFDDRETAN